MWYKKYAIILYGLTPGRANTQAVLSNNHRNPIGKRYFLPSDKGISEGAFLSICVISDFLSESVLTLKIQHNWIKLEL